MAALGTSTRYCGLSAPPACRAGIDAYPNLGAGSHVVSSYQMRDPGVDVLGHQDGALTVRWQDQAPDDQPQQAFVHGIDVVVASEEGQQPRQCGLGAIMGQRRHAARITAGQMPE